MARRGSSDQASSQTSAARKRKSASGRLKPVLAESVETRPVDVADDPLTLDPRPYAPRKTRGAAKPAALKPAALKIASRRPGRVAAAVAVTLAVGGAVTVGVVQAMNAHGHRTPLSSSVAYAPRAVKHLDVEAATPAAAVVEAKPLTEYQPPDREQVSSAFLKVGAVYRNEGLSGVVRQSMDCFSGLKSAPSYATLDFCIAADAFGEALQRKLSDGHPPASDSYFAAASTRELDAARTVVGADGDAGARVLDIHRLAGEVSQAGSGAAATLVAANEHMPPAAVVAPREEPAAVPVESAPAPMVTPRVTPAKRVAPVRHIQPRLEIASAPMRAPHPKLEKTRAHVEPLERPRLTRIAAAPAKSSHAHARLAREDDRDFAPAPRRERVVAASPRPHVARHAAREETGDDSPPWSGAIRAIRASLGARNDLAGRRASEPAEWVDCHRPRTPAEVRLCEGPYGGDGTLGGQYRSGGNR
ncbi:MAG TPA: hypothetical protein VGL66_09890 [Caulobacteraceae bacterium]|jgi:hypothetical protein